MWANYSFTLRVIQCLTNVAMGYLLIFKQDDLGDTLSGKDGRTASCLRVSGILFRFVSFRSDTLSRRRILGGHWTVSLHLQEWQVSPAVSEFG
jgi:hypothetical protein